MSAKKDCPRTGLRVFASCAMCVTTTAATAGPECRLCANTAMIEDRVRYDFDHTKKGAR